MCRGGCGGSESEIFFLKLGVILIKEGKLGSGKFLFFSWENFSMVVCGFEEF